MKLVEVHDLERWNAMIQQQAGSFLQYSKWGEYERQLGLDVYYLALEANGELLCGARVVCKSIAQGFKIMYSSRLMLNSDQVVQACFFEELRGWAAKHKALFFKYDTQNLIGDDAVAIGQAFKEVISPEYSFLLDLNVSEEDLLAQMHKKTRYNIRLAQRKGVDIGVYNSTEGAEQFVRLMTETARRDGFASHSEAYYKKLITSGLVDVYLAKVGDEYVAGALIHHCHKQAVYLHGASSHEHRALMAPYLVQWQAILDAKIKGLELYDFWGVQGQTEKASWAGFTRFKHGFNIHGQDTQYKGAFLVVYRPVLTWVYFLYRGIRAFITKFLKN
jgi:lipid II:glycine glycyltransferase (peptidoglycan interpeptide bridge formation enzyme)